MECSSCSGRDSRTKVQKPGCVWSWTLITRELLPLCQDWRHLDTTNSRLRPYIFSIAHLTVVKVTAKENIFCCTTGVKSEQKMLRQRFSDYDLLMLRQSFLRKKNKVVQMVEMWFSFHTWFIVVCLEKKKKNDYKSFIKHWPHQLVMYLSFIN